jgi:single-stranded DNA-specific DHH superfamily exonuclease
MQGLPSTKTGELARILNNVLKGSSSDAMKYVKALTRISEPIEILEPNDARGRFLLKKHKAVDEEYRKLLAEAKKAVTKDRFVVFTYHDNKMAFSSDLANEMIYHHPDKIVLIGREKSGEIKMSLRSNDTVLPPIIEKAMVGLQGYGGGHEYAAGACVKAENFSDFVDNLKNIIR